MKQAKQSLVLSKQKKLKNTFLNTIVLIVICSIEFYHLVSFCMLKENQLQVLRLKEKIADKTYIKIPQK